MVALRSRRLDALFGASLDDLTADHVRSLPEAGAQEAFDLDFKGKLYGRGDSDRRALAGDVAALANTAGGVIVIGIEEDEQARATGAPGVVVSDAERNRYLQVVASLVSPMPTFDIVPVLDPPANANQAAAPAGGEPAQGHGFIIIAVVRSPNAPHAVLVNEALRYPKRNGTTTRYLSEPEVAAAYRDRLAGAARQAERSATVEKEAIARLDRGTGPWLVVSLVPDLPGDMVITTRSAEDFRSAITNTRATIIAAGPTLVRASVGRRRLLADDSMNDSPSPSSVSLELHTDGAGTYAVKLYDLLAAHNAQHGNGPIRQRIEDEYIALAGASGVLWLAQHARDRAAAGGNAIVRMTLLPTPAADSLEVGHSRGFPDNRGRPVASADPMTAETVAVLDDIAAPSPALVSTVAVLADELGQAFGVPEMGQFARDGCIRRPYWGRYWQQPLVAWAEQGEIEITDETLAP